MVRLRAVVLMLSTVSTAAHAAEITRIASSFEEGDPFGMFIDVGFERSQNRMKITRENHQFGTLQDVDELRFVDIDTRLNIDAHIGLYQDLEFSFGLPIVFGQDRRWRFAQTPGSPTNAGNSTITNNCVQ